MGSFFAPSYSMSKSHPDSIIKYITLKNGNLAILGKNDIEILSGRNLEKLFTITPTPDSEDYLIIPPKIHSSQLYLIDLIQTNNENLILSLNYATKVISLSENNSYNITQTITRGFENYFYKIMEVKNYLFCFESSKKNKNIKYKYIIIVIQKIITSIAQI